MVFVFDVTYISPTNVYLRDASGNVMAIYETIDNTETPSEDNIAIKEIPIYSSTRLGQYRPFKAPTEGENTNKKTALGQRIYEFSNHLGNVLVTLTDNKVPNQDGTYKAIVLSASDYYPFGMAMKERTYQNSEYRFGFNGQEQSDELDENGNSYTAEFWQYDSRIGRRWNIDPITVPWESSYAAFRNNPIVFNDPSGAYPSEGDGEGHPTNVSEGHSYTHENGKTYRYDEGKWAEQLDAVEVGTEPTVSSSSLFSFVFGNGTTTNDPPRTPIPSPPRTPVPVKPPNRRIIAKLPVEQFPILRFTNSNEFIEYSEYNKNSPSVNAEYWNDTFDLMKGNLGANFGLYLKINTIVTRASITMSNGQIVKTTNEKFINHGIGFKANPYLPFFQGLELNSELGINTGRNVYKATIHLPFYIGIDLGWKTNQKGWITGIFGTASFRTKAGYAFGYGGRGGGSAGLGFVGGD